MCDILHHFQDHTSQSSVPLVLHADTFHCHHGHASSITPLVADLKGPSLNSLNGFPVLSLRGLYHDESYMVSHSRKLHFGFKLQTWHKCMTLFTLLETIHCFMKFHNDTIHLNTFYFILFIF